MLNVSRILVSAPARRLVLAAAVVGPLAACGQKGPLFLPTDPVAAQRATLPQTLRPAAPASAPATGTASPIPGQ
ncbi:LPS translocon maturation chaperone LptM [Ramlibacter sp.]|uniref:LPS translocon maturation chaperone LptM n=1 Tax=Ramlibacter sp. TaxID=1917967 RepID=UPI002CF5C718|nr:lipoprotein [Ramlibacter sp.]HWI84585.1 lipoprotein [Ramlibacter sp.]